MYLFDKEIINFIIRKIPHSLSFYEVVLFISNNYLLKGGVLALLMWYLWFKNATGLKQKRVHIIATLISVFGAMMISRTTTMLAPFQARPILSNEVTYFSFETDTTEIDRMSSFPSDHAALFICLAVGLLFVSRRVGLFALAYTFLFILFPRVYLGYHYPSDIVAGGLIGAVMGIIFNKWKWIQNLLSKYIFTFSERYPQYFYPLFFLMCFEIVVLFKDLREWGGFVSHLLSN